MDSKTQEICSATNRFYGENASSFSSTRQHPWIGWERLTPHLRHLPEDLTVLDAACGNLRFERFMEAQGLRPARVLAIDQCVQLLNAEAPKGMPIERIQADIIALVDGAEGFESLGCAPCDLTVAFGFMHHLPTPALRQSLLEALLNSTKPSGLCAISFWQFGKDERLAAKAARATTVAERAFGISLKDERDHFLGWQGDRQSLRFCHDFSDDEVDALKGFAQRQGASVIDDFTADGKSHDLNRYLVLRRH